MPKTLRGRASTFGRDPKTGYVDPGDNGQNASGLPQGTPGIAAFDRSTLGGWWRVTAPNGKSMTVRQVDIGPSPSTGRQLDINSPLARQFGYKQGNSFPTDQGTWKAEFLGKKAPADAGAVSGGKAQRTGITPTSQQTQDPTASSSAVDEESRKLAILQWFLARRGKQNSTVSRSLLG